MSKQVNKNKRDHKFLEFAVSIPSTRVNIHPTKATNPNIHEDKAQAMEPTITKGSTPNIKFTAKLRKRRGRGK